MGVQIGVKAADGTVFGVGNPVAFLTPLAAVIANKTHKRYDSINLCHSERGFLTRVEESSEVI